jgi:hypothetical protein
MSYKSFYTAVNYAILPCSTTKPCPRTDRKHWTRADVFLQ